MTHFFSPTGSAKDNQFFGSGSAFPWGVEVRLPDGFVTAGAGRKNKRPLAGSGLTMSEHVGPLLAGPRGYDIGQIDGMLGEKSRAAIKQEQERLAMEASGRGGQKLLKALRQGN